MSAYAVLSPEGALMVEPFENFVDALVYMRLFGRPGARVMMGETVLAVRVAATGTRATLKGALGRRRGRPGPLDATLEDEDESAIDDGDA